MHAASVSLAPVVHFALDEPHLPFPGVHVKTLVLRRRPIAIHAACAAGF